MINNIDMDIIVYSVGSACDGKIWRYKGTDYKSKKELNDVLKADGVDDTCCVCRNEPESWESTRDSVVSYTEGIISKYDCDFQGHISGKSNFRYDIATILPYKGNRVSVSKPFHYDAIRQFLVDAYDAKMSEGIEADDAIGLSHIVDEDIISTQDKDLNCIPGLHYNWVKDEEFYVSIVDANRNFFCQMLTGDSTDNILGLYGVGSKSKLLSDIKSLDKEEEMFELVKQQYVNRFGNHWGMFFKENANLLWIKQRREPVWF